MWMLSVWKLIAGNSKLILIAVSLAGLSWGAVAYTDYVTDNALAAGAKAERDIWEKKEYDREKAYNQELSRLLTLKYDTEDDLKERLLRLEIDYEDKIKNIKEHTDTLLADVRNDNVRLRVKLNTSSNSTADSASTDTADASSGGNGAASSGVLHRDTSEFLIRQARLADEVSTRLLACQNVIREYKSTVDEYNATYFAGIVSE